MPKANLDPRIQMHIELALSADYACGQTVIGQDARARELGLLGAEVDAARNGSGFDVNAAAAVQYACAFRAGHARALAKARQIALKTGFTANDIVAIEIIALKLMNNYREMLGD